MRRNLAASLALQLIFVLVLSVIAENRTTTVKNTTTAKGLDCLRTRNISHVPYAFVWLIDWTVGILLFSTEDVEETKNVCSQILSHSKRHM